MKNYINLTLNNYLKSINEIKIAEFNITKYSDIEYSGKFKLNGILYNVKVWHDSNKHNIGEFEVEFSYLNQKNASDRTGLDIKHLNDVLYTTFEIVEQIIKENNITKILIDSANEQGDDYIDTLRSKVYYRFLLNKYPKEMIDRNGRFIRVNFETEDNQSSYLDRITSLLLEISDIDPDIDGIKRGINGISDDNFEVNTDYIINSKHGSIYVEIIVNKKHSIYTTEFEMLDTEYKNTGEFDSFDELYNFIKSELK